MSTTRPASAANLLAYKKPSCPVCHHRSSPRLYPSAAAVICRRATAVARQSPQQPRKYPVYPPRIRPKTPTRRSVRRYVGIYLANPPPKQSRTSSRPYIRSGRHGPAVASRQSRILWTVAPRCAPIGSLQLLSPVVRRCRQLGTASWAQLSPRLDVTTNEPPSRWVLARWITATYFNKVS
ncbi:hypothetical protein VTK56DRAFT_7273 [Thermocarpiscus australiensis]